MWRKPSFWIGKPSTNSSFPHLCWFNPGLCHPLSGTHLLAFTLKENLYQQRSNTWGNHEKLGYWPSQDFADTCYPWRVPSQHVSSRCNMKILYMHKLVRIHLNLFLFSLHGKSSHANIYIYIYLHIQTNTWTYTLDNSRWQSPQCILIILPFTHQCLMRHLLKLLGICWVFHVMLWQTVVDQVASSSQWSISKLSTEWLLKGDIMSVDYWKIQWVLTHWIDAIP